MAQEETQESRVPRNVDAERNLLGSLMLRGELISQLEGEFQLEPDNFFSERHRVVFEAIKKRALKSSDFNPTVIIGDLESNGQLERAGGSEYVFSLTEITGPVYAIREYAAIVRDTALRRGLLGISDQIALLAYSPDGRSCDELLDQSQGLIFKLAETRQRSTAGPRSMYEISCDILQEFREMEASTERLTGVPTGFAALDRLTSGLQPGSLNIVAARPGVGKTTFAMNVVENIALNPAVDKPALVFSLEMPSVQIAKRMISSFGRVSVKDLEAGMANTNNWQMIATKLKMLRVKDENGEPRDKLFIDDSGDLTPLELRLRARRIHQLAGGLSCIMVDYIQLMRGNGRTENRSLEVGEISRSLKMLAKELSVPVIALSQLNRKVVEREGNRPMNSDLRESGSLEQDADLIMFIHRESAYTKKKDQEEFKDDGKALLIVSKNRNGGLEDIDLLFQGEYTAFYDASYVDQGETPLPEEE
ncbi:MAG: replicative DNA helicase [Succinivibrionaceae bacterium]|nr:replicative DNA helicase [Succinivibrionaceae bacterium]